MSEKLLQDALHGERRDFHNDILTKRDAASFFKVSVRTIETWMRAGLLAHLKIGKIVRFKRADVMESLERFKVQGKRNR